jgi:hypothetical protein
MDSALEKKEMKYIPIVLLASVVLFGSRYEGSTTPAVALAGGIIKSTHIEPSDQKYKRKDCPVCKGTGKYLSGDGIKMVDCGYCEPEKNKGQVEQPKTVIQHPPIILKSVPQCSGPNCRITQ